MALERVQKIMSNAGLCSRRRAEEIIAEGKVFVNSTKIKLGDKADPDKDTILINGKPLTIEKKKYYAFYKPSHVLTTLHDPFGKPTISEYIGSLPVRVFPVGRLDFDAEGLLILTNDGDFANKIMHPRYETLKTYEAELRDRIRDDDLSKLKGTVLLDDGPVRIEACKRLNESTIEVTIHEGRHKIVKRIFKDLGFYVKRLKRTQVGPVKLERLHPGELKEIPEFVIKGILNSEKKQEKGRPQGMQKNAQRYKATDFKKSSNDNKKNNARSFEKRKENKSFEKKSFERKSSERRPESKPRFEQNVEFRKKSNSFSRPKPMSKGRARAISKPKSSRGFQRR